MPKYVALLRGINLGRRRLKMDRLRELFEQLNFAHVTTLIASGNVLFETRRSDEKKFQQQIEKHLEQELGYAVDTFIRSAEELKSIAAHDPFAAMKNSADARVHVAFLHEMLDPRTSQKLVACRTEFDEFNVVGREIHWLCQTRISDSEVWNLPEVKSLTLPVMTMRNMTTVHKLAKLLSSTSSKDSKH